MSKKLLILLFIGFSASANAQTGGLYTFQALNTLYSAHQLGLGGNLIAVRDNDLNVSFSNPAALNEEMMFKGSLSENLRAGGINNGSIAYGRSFNKIYSSAHFRYVSYGSMKRTDIAGNELGNFSTGDYILGGSASKLINERMSIGATFNFILSQLDSYYAIGNSIDIGGQYFVKEKDFVVGGVVKNLGVQWKGFNSNRSPLPIEVQLGVSKKLSHAPFKFSLTAQHLQQWDLSYNDPNAKDKIDLLTGDTIKVKRAGFFEKAARHALLQTELNFGKKVFIRAGFDVQRRLEMRVANRPGLAGFSFGTAFYLKRFTFEYGWLIYSSAGSQHGISLSIPIGQKP